MSFQAYLDNIKEKTGKTPEDFAKLATKKGLTTIGEIVSWLKNDFELGHGHARAIAGILVGADKPKANPQEKLDALFTGEKEHWRKARDGLLAKVRKFGSDVSITAGGTYVTLLRAGKKFDILQSSSVERLALGIKLKGAAPEGRFEPSDKWNTAVTHRVRTHETKELDDEVLSWLRRAYDAAV